jgi:hypothetical protein
MAKPTHQKPLPKSAEPTDCKKITKKFVVTTTSKEAPQLIFLSGVQLAAPFPSFIRVSPNGKTQPRRAEDSSQPRDFPANPRRFPALAEVIWFGGGITHTDLAADW